MPRRRGGEGREDDARQPDLFFAFVGEVPVRDDREAMSLPLVSLSKRKRVTPIEWQNGDGSVWVRVTATPTHGMATIYDLDVILWAVSQLNEAVERGAEPPRVIRFQPYDLLRSIGRDVGGENYRQLEDTLRRLDSTRIETSVRADKRNRKAMFGWLEGWTHDVDETTGRSRGMSLTIPHWLWDGVVKRRDVLAVSPDYFNLSSGLARWLYRLARRHAGKQPEGWRFTMRHLWERSGSTQAYGDFARDLRRVIAANRLPEYRVEVMTGQRGDEVVWMVRDPMRAKVPQRRDLRPVALSAPEPPPTPSRRRGRKPGRAGVD